MRNALFENIRVKAPKKNVFDLSHEKKLSCNMGDLVPIFLQEVIPGDTFQVNSEILMRLAPLVAPVMHRVNVFTHYFFVPNRLVYGDWEDFITGGVDGQSNPAFPKISYDSDGTHPRLPTVGSLSDFMGVPTVPTTLTGETSLPEVTALPFRAYQLIWNTYYRDQTLHAEVPVTKNSTVTESEQVAILELQKRCWEKDYFTSALPWAQRGGDVVLPTDVSYLANSQVFRNDGTAPSAVTSIKTSAGGNALLVDSDSNPGRIQNINNVDITVNNLRRAQRLQIWLEKNARAGSRYIEQIWSHFAVKSSDARLQRPEYLGGGKQPVVMSEVLSTAQTEDMPVGSMAGHGISVGNSNRFKKSFEEHGYIIGIMSVLPRTAYQQGCGRDLQKFDKFDYFWPEFANIGEQEITKGELYWDSSKTSPANFAVFGYQSRYAEYKFKQSTVHGDFRNTLYFWHMGRIFDSQPGLNDDFVTADPTDRIFAVLGTENDHLWIQLYNQVTAIRPMPVFGTPSI
jgi:hypothetical protein